MSTPRLTRASVPADRVLGAPAAGRTGIVHLGLGNFHRAHAAVHTARALAADPAATDWGIVGVANSSHRVVDPMAAQDHLYSVLELSPEGRRADVVDVHRRTLVAAEQPAELLAALADPGHRIVTLTATEHGYTRDAATGRLDLASAAVRADLADPGAPRTVVGRLSRGLLRRFAESGAPLTVQSCDNLQANGTTTRALVTEFCERAGAPGPFWDWLADSVAFPNAMVDRIVPATDDATVAEVGRLLGLADAVPVPAERFSMWVVEDRFAAGRPAWERAGVTFSDEVAAYELVKLRLLNGSHSLIAYLGALDGRETIPDARGQEFVARCVDAAIRREYLPSIRLPRGFDAEDYIARLFDRWNNRALGDRTARVGTDGSTKLLQRVPGPAVRLLARGETPHQLALTVAAWLACVAPPAGFDPGPIAAAMGEPARERLAAATAGAATTRAHVAAVLRGGFFPDELAAYDAFTDRVAELTETITRDGVRAAAADALAG